MDTLCRCLQTSTAGTRLALIVNEKTMISVVMLLNGKVSCRQRDVFGLCDLNIAIVKDFFSVMFADLDRALFGPDEAVSEIVIDQYESLARTLFSDYLALQIPLTLKMGAEVHEMDLIMSHACLERWKKANKLPSLQRAARVSKKKCLPVLAPVAAGTLELAPGARIIMPAK